MKRKLVTCISRGFVAVVVIFAVLLFSPAKMGNAATASATTIDPKTTIAELLPADDPNAMIVREALYNGKKYDGNPSGLSSDSTFQNVINASLQITIDTPMNDYGPLMKIANTLSELNLHQQTHLTSKNIPEILTAMATNRPIIKTRPAAQQPVGVDFSDNQLDNTQFAAMMAAMPLVFSKEYGGQIDVTQNKITDFSPYLTYLNSLGTPDAARKVNLAAFNQTGTDGVTLPTQKITGNTLELPFSFFPEYREQSNQSAFVDDTNVKYTIASRVYRGDEDYFNNPENINETHQVQAGDGVKTALKTFTLVDLDDLSTKLPVDISGINRLDASQAGTTTYFKQLNSKVWVDLEYAQKNMPSNLTGALPDKSTLKITNIPAGSTAIKIRIIVLNSSNYQNAPFTGYAQTYKIPLERDNQAPQPTTPATASSESGAEPVKAVTKQKVVSPIRKIGLYQHPTFTAKARSRWYPRQSRTQRPMLKVLGYAHSKNGLLRYRVKDVSPGASGQTGYITARTDYIVNTYYQTTATKIKVLWGLNSYTNRQLTGQRRHFAKNKIVRVKRLVTHNLTTRYQLSNGQYVSANKRLVIRVK